MNDQDDRELTPADAREMRGQGDAVVWVVLRGWPGDTLVARPHTLAQDGGRFLPGWVTASTLEELRALLPVGLTRCEAWPGVTPPEWVEWWG